MDSLAEPTEPHGRTALAKHLPGPAFVRHYIAYDLVTWQPKGTLDDDILDQIAEWVVAIEKVILPFKRFVDLSQLTNVAITTRHLLAFAQKRAEQFAGTESVRTALFSDEWVAFGVARMYESLMENTPIKARAFRDRAKAAEWLGVPADILMLSHEPGPYLRTASKG